VDTPLYKLYLFKRTAQYYDLSQAGWAQLSAEILSQQRALGVRDLFNAEMAWSNEHYEFFGVEFYPSLEAARNYTHCLQKLGYYRYVTGDSFLGLPMDNTYPDFSIEPPTRSENLVYRVYLAHQTSYARQMPSDETEKRFGLAADAFKSAGGTVMLNAYMRWNFEGYEYFGIERYPDLEAVIGYTQLLSSNGWYDLMASRSYLGTAYGGLIAGMKAELS
jgi:hypothetical protein